MSRILIFWRGALFLAIIVALTMAFLPHPPALPIDHYGDKFEHVLAFSTIALLAAFAYPRTPLLRLTEHLSFLGALIEVGQSMPILGRDCDIRDWIADTVAVIVVLLLVKAFRKARAR
ncbi:MULTISPECIES: hypothetical protein [unclassified Sphingomonas]|uniref:hypothetical protein n=1 Tax=unclassified Sphingomonas TaxID=196159 RepID=UPI001F5A4335|nr:MULTISPECIES: hypothetical protein [unclassified Sphingomonas]